MRCPIDDVVLNACVTDTKLLTTPLCTFDQTGRDNNFAPRLRSYGAVFVVATRFGERGANHHLARGTKPRTLAKYIDMMLDAMTA